MRNIDSGAKLSVHAGVFAASCAGLLMEVCLTRIFSYTIWYHFAFLVISMALLGFGASGSLLTLYRRYKGTEVISERWLPWTTAGAGLGMILAVVVISSIQFNPFSMSDDGYELWNGISYLVMVTVPFLFIGATIAIALDAYSEQAGTLYFADLLGAGVGCLSFVVLMDWFGPKAVLAIAGTLLVVAMLALASPPKRTVVVVAPLLLVAVFAATLTATFTPCKGC